jgi:hypothetical protein
MIFNFQLLKVIIITRMGWEWRQEYEGLLQHLNILATILEEIRKVANFIA